VSQEPQNVLGGDVHVVITEKVKFRLRAVPSGPLEAHHGFDGVVVVGVHEVSLHDVAKLFLLLANLSLEAKKVVLVCIIKKVRFQEQQFKKIAVGMGKK